MKQIIAYIKEHKLEAIVLALHEIDGLTGVSILEIQGFGRSRRTDPNRLFDNDSLNLVKRYKLEISCPDHLTEQVTKTIQQQAHTGLKGDGKIYQLPLENAVRISSGEQGEVAV